MAITWQPATSAPMVVGAYANSPYSEADVNACSGWNQIVMAFLRYKQYGGISGTISLSGSTLVLTNAAAANLETCINNLRTYYGLGSYSFGDRDPLNEAYLNDLRDAFTDLPAYIRYTGKIPYSHLRKIGGLGVCPPDVFYAGTGSYKDAQFLMKYKADDSVEGSIHRKFYFAIYVAGLEATSCNVITDWSMTHDSGSTGSSMYFLLYEDSGANWSGGTLRKSIALPDYGSGSISIGSFTVAVSGQEYLYLRGEFSTCPDQPTPGVRSEQSVEMDCPSSEIRLS